ncbi:uncharacterized protein LOC103095138 [Monodelphis domestica]|uniref:uncharacterized protein LOC103095138 n=1 Tax=Monodelphis domestica TaxID=13616 RepID=UPI0024E262FC|nr:uncharacterized protein LOC103095138 [Monodelphis domestica]XP_056681759.1 uncharacterized protein LOC103095138 [Monodelphis domestica]XP_056681760.1 uncharacterized protein LOC103095138 [Monodelphis domestica]XP_056681761.1 uncharacterized protein LOC103095138 [Monodelphis domestica]XP_056681762.1 uncharacterized protein LOC103095138 [Monodelphis domestica]
MNNNSLLLLSKCAEFELTIMNNVFRMANKYKRTCMHPRSKQWHLIDYIIVSRQDIQDVLITRAMRGAECWTDHRLVRATLQMRMAPHHPKRAQTVCTFYSVSRLRDPSYLQTFQSCLDNKLSAKGPLTRSSTEKWNQFRDTVKETSKAVLGPKQHNPQDWFDENNTAIEDLLSKKNKAFMEWQNNPNSAPKKDRFKSLQATAQYKIRKMQDQWWGKKAEEIQRFADTKNYKQLFNALKTVYGPLKPTTTPLLSSDGDTLIKDKKGISNMWKEHFSQLLNRPSSVDQRALDQVPQNHTIEELDIPPSIEEVYMINGNKAICRL